MKKLFQISMLGIMLTGVFANVQAQLRPHYSQYILNNFIINPAVAGIENYTDVKISHRHQWVGIQDAPVTTYLTVHGSIGKDDQRTSPTTLLPDGDNPRGRAYWEQYESAKPHHGWGATVVNDRTGPLNRLSVYGTYAYHLGISAQTSLSAGISVGVTNNTIKTDKLIFDNPIDPVVANSNLLNRWRPDVNLGVYLYSADYFAGFSVQQILDQGFIFASDTLTTASKSYPHLFMTAGFKTYAGEDFAIIPSVVFRYINSLPLGVDVNVKAQYRDRFWVGAGYRLRDGIVGMAGVNVSSMFSVGYAYDYTTSALQNYTSGTHEIVIGFLLGNKWGDTCPRNLW